ncbi:universal stress protein [Methylorubrum rhodinum]
MFHLTVLDASRPGGDIDLERAEKLLFGSGRPVAVVPPGVSIFSAKRILVAWDSGTQAARAINDAMPFLRAAEAVEVACVVGIRDMADTVAGAEIAPHLARHGVNVTVDDLPAYGRVEDILRNQAGLFRADLVVMGAYRHSRLREMVFDREVGPCRMVTFR